MEHNVLIIYMSIRINIGEKIGQLMGILLAEFKEIGMCCTCNY